MDRTDKLDGHTIAAGTSHSSSGTVNGTGLVGATLYAAFKLSVRDDDAVFVKSSASAAEIEILSQSDTVIDFRLKIDPADTASPGEPTPNPAQVVYAGQLATRPTVTLHYAIWLQSGQTVHSLTRGTVLISKEAITEYP